MLNQVHQEGFVTKKQWTYNNDYFFRLAVYRDPDRQRKQAADPGPDRVDAPDYITVCLPEGLRLPGEIRAGQRLQVDGWLESRHYEVSLDEFLQKAHGPKVSVVVDGEMAQRISVDRTTTWIVADRVVIVPPGDRRPRRGRRRRGIKIAALPVSVNRHRLRAGDIGDSDPGNLQQTKLVYRYRKQRVSQESTVLVELDCQGVEGGLQWQN